MNLFGEHLGYLRKANGMTQEDLAKKLKCTKQAISHYETGKRDPSIDTLVEISRIFNVDLDSLLVTKSNLGSDVAPKKHNIFDDMPPEFVKKLKEEFDNATPIKPGEDEESDILFAIESQRALDEYRSDALEEKLNSLFPCLSLECKLMLVNFAEFLLWQQEKRGKRNAE